MRHIKRFTFDILFDDIDGDLSPEAIANSIECAYEGTIVINQTEKNVDKQYPQELEEE